MRFLVDAQLPPQMADWLKAAGFEASLVGEVLGQRAKDKAIVAEAMATGAFVVSKDSDFLGLSPPPPQLLLITLGNASNRSLKSLFDQQFPVCLGQLERGQTVVEMG